MKNSKWPSMFCITLWWGIWSLFNSCMAQTNTPLILISKEYDNLSYSKWIAQKDKQVRWESAYGKSAAEVEKLKAEASGFLMTGGKDVHPSLYGQQADIDRCGPIDVYRDSLEIDLIHYALNNKKPLLCVCRGEQILNVSQGGTLIVDIPEDVGEKVAHTDTAVGYDAVHGVSVVSGTLLYKLVGKNTGTINSKHHQAVNQPEPGWVVSAWAPDGVAEALEMSPENRLKTAHPFALGVQWHPERMDISSPFSGKILEAYLKAVWEYKR